LELPNQYPYNLRPRLIVLVFATGLLWIAMGYLSLGHLPTGFGLWFGIIPIGLALLVGVRGILAKRYLVLDNDSMILPTGPLQMRTTKIEYSSIKRVWRHYLPLTVVLRVATEKRNFEILSTLLPDNASYLALEEFLNRKALENTGVEKSPRN